MAAIAVQGLTKRFRDTVAVDGLSFEVAAGSVTGFLGPNGSGKTTTLRCLLGLVAPTRGRATVLGVPYRELPDPLLDEGGYAAVDAALRDPPTTTAEIYDPQRYLDGFEPERIDVPPAPGGGWSELATGTFGAFDLGQLLAERSVAAANEAALGWSGGSLGVWTRGAELALAAHVRFDDEEAARTTCDELPRWYAQVAGGEPAGEGRYQGDRDALAVACEPGGVRFGLAPDAATAAALVGSP